MSDSFEDFEEVRKYVEEDPGRLSRMLDQVGNELGRVIPELPPHIIDVPLYEAVGMLATAGRRTLMHWREEIISKFTEPVAWLINDLSNSKVFIDNRLILEVQCMAIVDFLEHRNIYSSDTANQAINNLIEDILHQHHNIPLLDRAIEAEFRNFLKELHEDLDL